MKYDMKSFAILSFFIFGSELLFAHADSSTVLETNTNPIHHDSTKPVRKTVRIIRRPNNSLDASSTTSTTIGTTGSNSRRRKRLETKLHIHSTKLPSSTKAPSTKAPSYSTKSPISTKAPTSTKAPSPAPTESYCQDDPTYRFMTEHVGYKNCEWLGMKDVRKRKYCRVKSEDNKAENRFGCREACSSFIRRCIDVNDTLEPTPSPTPLPTLQPTLSPTEYCADDLNAEFEIREGQMRNCQWLSERRKRQIKYCQVKGITNPNGLSRIKFACRESCSNYLRRCKIKTPTVSPTTIPSVGPSLGGCVDDASFRFYTGYNIVGCGWLYNGRKGKDRRVEWCETKSPASKAMIKYACRNACKEYLKDCRSSSKGGGKGSGSKGKGKGSKGKGSKGASPSPTTASPVTPTTLPSMSPTLTLSTTPTISNQPTISFAPSIYDCSSPDGRTRDVNALVDSISESLEDDTPQADALDWLMSVDADTNICDGDTQMKQRYVLTVLFYSTNGDDWNRSNGWLDPSTDECDWYGIICNAGSVITKLKLEKNNLSGTLPTELKRLDKLKDIFVFDNQLYGDIPSEIWKIPFIRNLDLEKNQFHGTLFSTDKPYLEAASTLETLLVSNNNLVGAIPSDIEQMTKLKTLWIAENELTGSLPDEINALTNLNDFILYNNDFDGSIPEELDGLSNLERFYASNNSFVGSIPSSMGLWTKIEKLLIEDNNLDGSIPESFSELTSLVSFFGQNNDLSGAFPDFNNLTALEELTLQNNSFTGSFPQINSNVLDFLDLRFNSISGTIPETIFALESLRILYLSSNSLSGPLPSNYGNASALRDLYLSDNNLSGLIPEVIPPDGLKSISEILLNQNRFSGSVPESLCAIRDAFPLNFTSLHADCLPPEGSDVPQNPCALGCCTDCSVGKGIDSSDRVLELRLIHKHR